MNDANAWDGDSAFTSEGMNRKPPRKDWRVVELIDHGPGGGRYGQRFTVKGENLNWHPTHPNFRFEWDVRDPEMNERYDLTQAKRTMGGAR